MFFCFLISFGPYRSLQWKVIPFKALCYFLEWKNYCLRFRFPPAYISLILVPLLQLCVFPVFTSEGILNFTSRAVANMKTQLTDFDIPAITQELNNCCYFLHTHTVQLCLYQCLTCIDGHFNKFRLHVQTLEIIYR